MVLIEGGGFRCDLHDFTTKDVEEWNEHCYGNPEHTESGTTICVDCGTPLAFSGLPFHKINPVSGSKDISLKCEECEARTVGMVKRTVIPQ